MRAVLFNVFVVFRFLHIFIHSEKEKTLQKKFHSKGIVFMCSKRNRMVCGSYKKVQFTYQLTFLICVCMVYAVTSLTVCNRNFAHAFIFRHVNKRANKTDIHFAEFRFTGAQVNFNISF